MPSSVAFHLPAAAPDDRSPVRVEHRVALADARLRAVPVVTALLEAVRTAPDTELDRRLPVVMRELDLLWQALGRVTQP